MARGRGRQLTQPQAIAPEQDIEKARRVLGQRNLVFVGLMGAGKSAIGRLVAQMLGIPFVDSDHEIERVSRMTIRNCSKPMANRSSGRLRRG
jgi:shikimate kinase